MGDNCLLAHEVLTYVKRRKKGLRRFAVLKIDMNKAYDRVNWQFIGWILDHMEFPAVWRHWIMQCVSTVSYSILVNANTSACRNIRNTIDLFCKVSGEAINFDKSNVIFSPNTPSNIKNVLKQILGTPCTDSLGRYLGCNIEVDGRSSHAFDPLVEKVQKKISSWKHLSLSPAGRLLLINGILASLCSNVLAVFLVPKLISKKINSLLMWYWWRTSSMHMGICWVKRAKLEVPKGMGGIGLRNIVMFNQALLVKQAIRNIKTQTRSSQKSIERLMVRHHWKLA
ncbi:uncharacterized protein [Spinacia oleracea]|uniref:Reverse transcriptase domain-containing protein n=1 Tax=Spinacia oleracea TaxID=3562 RepID=A0ABM3R4E9_SPIOL|nr:uncharacterized protein LOC130465653 [Spinacia oleracea]